ncbi:MAG: hypothetical protein Q8R36_00875 [bacterium]|nr:hypothetical protein [bacterium]
MISIKEQYKDALKTIVDEVKKVVALIVGEGGIGEKEARERFNQELFDRFHTVFFEQNKKSLLRYSSNASYRKNNGSNGECSERSCYH